jgi:hypothetical protein
MESPAATTSIEYARVVWASHILSYMDPHSGQLQAPRSTAGHDSVDDDEDELDEHADDEISTTNTDLLTSLDTSIREKFLNCIAELLSHSKGGPHVTAVALREREDLVEVDLSRNGGFTTEDDMYLALLAEFLSHADIGEYTLYGSGFQFADRRI